MSKSVTLLFPGQGSQYVGMGQSESDQPQFELYNKANEVLGYDLKKMMLEGPQEELTLTQNTQPAILTHSLLLYRKLIPLLEKHDVKVERTMGHSVGEYAALVAAGSLSFEDAVNLVHKRGQFMQEAVPAGKGKMVAVMKVPAELIEKACKESSTETEKVMPANFNEPGQTVISGHAAACDRASAYIEEHHSDPHRLVELQVSAPFHSALMAPAAQKLEDELKKAQITSNNIPYIANIDAKEYAAGTSPETIQNNLVRQVDGAVLWSQSFSQLPDETLALEVGPGRTLMGLGRKINRNIKIHPLDREGAFEKVEELLS